MYKLSEVADAVGINPRTLSDWLDRGIIDAGRPGRGTHREFGVRDVDRIAIIHELTRVGLPVGEAAKAASVFSDERSFKRPRAQLHDDGAKTILLVTSDGASVHRAYDRESFDDAMVKLFGDERTITLLNVGATLKRVDAALAAGDSTPKPPAAAVYRNGRQMYS